MQIRRHVTDDVVEMRVIGRLDGHWAPHLATEIDDVIREGHSHIRLNLSGLDYLSSAGIQVLVRYYQELSQRQGSLDVARPSDPVRKMLGLSGLERLLVRVESSASNTNGSRNLEIAGTRIEASLTRGASHQCRVRQDDPNRPLGSLTCWKDTLAIGYGGFTPDGSANPFGPFLVVAGAAVCLPADAEGTPDYMLSTGSFVPELSVRMSIASSGTFAARAEFSGIPANLATLSSAALDILDADFAVLAVVGNGELHRPVLAAGVAGRKSSSLLGPLMQPLTIGQWPTGLFTGCVFSQAQEMPDKATLEGAVALLFQNGSAPVRMLTGGPACRTRLQSGWFFASPLTSLTADTAA